MTTKIEFLEKLFGTYSNSWNEKNKTLKMEQYILILKKDNIDYDKLFEVITEENTSEFMPQPAWIKEKIPKCIKYGNSRKWLQVEILDPRNNKSKKTDAFPFGTSIETMLKTYEKKFNCTGWKILRVY